MRISECGMKGEKHRNNRVHMVNLKINGKQITVPAGTTVLEAARRNDIYIPTLCDHPKLEPYGGCRLCLVQVKGMPRPVTACTTPVTEGMEVETSNDRSSGSCARSSSSSSPTIPTTAWSAKRAGDCTLQELAYFYDLRTNRSRASGDRTRRKTAIPSSSGTWRSASSAANASRSATRSRAWRPSTSDTAASSRKVSTPFEKDLNCEFCGQCVSVCPTGALMGKQGLGKGRQKDVKEVDTVCAYCGRGCNITAHVKHNEIVRITSRRDTSNEGWLCVKGRFGYNFVNSPDRLTTPLIKKDGKFAEASWDEAFGYIAERLSAIKQKHGPDAIGGLSSAKCTNEENYLFQKFMRAGIGTNNVDHCARL